MSERAAFVTAHRFELVVVRHGRTAWNETGRFQGHTDVPLDAIGQEQARALAASFRGERFDVAVTSDLARARATAAAVLQGRTTVLEVDARWREMGFGTWEGLTWGEILAREPAMAGRSLADPGGYTPRDGEAFGAVCERVAAAVRALDGVLHDGARGLVATHAGTLHALLHVVLGATEAARLRVRFSPASVTRLQFEPAGAHVLELNRTLPSPVAGHGPKSE